MTSDSPNDSKRSGAAQKSNLIGFKLWAKRVVAGLVLGFITLQLLIAMVLNFDFAQNFLLAHAAKIIQHRIGVNVEIQEVDLGFFPPALHLDGLTVKDFLNLVQDAEEAQKLEGLELSVSRASVHLSFIMLRTSLAGSVRGVQLEGVRIHDPNGGLFQFLKSEPPPDAEEPLKNGNLIAQNWQLNRNLPAQISLKDLVIELGRPSDNQFALFELANLTSISRDRSERSILVELEDSVLKSPELPASLAVFGSRLEASLHESGRLNVESFQIEADGIEMKAQGSLASDGALEPMSGSFQLESNIEARILRMFGIESAGRVNVSGLLEVGDRTRFQGDASWEDLWLDGFAVYTGGAVMRLEGSEIFVDELDVRTPQGGRIQANGKVLLSEGLPFEADVTIQDFPFLEMLAGYSVSSDAIDFLLKSDHVKVLGRGSYADERGFGLDFEGEVAATQLRIPIIERGEATGVLLPDCLIDLKLLVDRRGLNFDSSQVSCFANAPPIEVSVGRVVFQGGDTDFRIQTPLIDLYHVNYFTDLRLRGEGNLQGVIASDGPHRPVYFEADLGLDMGSILDVPLRGLEGKIRVDRDGVSLRGLHGNAGTMQDAEFHEVNIKVPFVGDEREAKNLVEVGFQLTADLAFLGQLPGLKRWSAIESAQGRIQGVKGDIVFDRETYVPDKIQLIGRIDEPSIGLISAQSLTFDINCDQTEACQSGELSLEQLKLADAQRSRVGILRFLLHSMKEQDLLAEMFLENVPVEFDSQVALSGTIDSRLKLSGQLQDPTFSGALLFKDLRYLEQDMGPLRMQVSRPPGGDLEASFSGFYQQVFGRLIVPFEDTRRGRIFASIRGFDMMSLFPNLRTQYGLYSEIDGSLDASFPSPLGKLPVGTQRWWSRTTLNGEVSRGMWALEGWELRPENRIKFSLGNGRIQVPQFVLQAQGGTLTAELQHNLIEGSGFAKVQAEARLDRFAQLVSDIESVSGSMKLDLRSEFLRGKRPSLEGTFEAYGESILLRDFPPELRDVYAEVRLADHRLEVVRFSGSKGGGRFELLGSVVLPAAADEWGDPEFGLQLRLTDLQTRLPSPIFKSVDAVLSGSVEVKGERRPYRLTGALQTNRLRATRNLTCDEIVAEAPTRSSRRIDGLKEDFFEFDFSLDANDTIVLQTQCVSSRLNAKMQIQGSENSPVLIGNISAEEGRVNLLNSRFSIVQADVSFDSPVTLDPRLNIQLVSQIDGYSVYLSVDGLASSPRTGFWSEPSSTASGQTLGRAEILRMIASGRAPREDEGGEGNLLANQVATYVYSSTALDDSLSRAFSRITEGFVDTVQVEPVIEGGQPGWKARISRSLGERFNLGLDLEQADLRSNQSVTGTLFVNENVNLKGGFDRTTNQTDSYFEMSGGLLFRFGGK